MGTSVAAEFEVVEGGFDLLRQTVNFDQLRPIEVMSKEVPKHFDALGKTVPITDEMEWPLIVRIT